MPVPEGPGKPSDDKTTAWPGIVHAHAKVDFPLPWIRNVIFIVFVIFTVIVIFIVVVIFITNLRKSPSSRQRPQYSKQWPSCQWSTFICLMYELCISSKLYYLSNMNFIFKVICNRLLTRWIRSPSRTAWRMWSLQRQASSPWDQSFFPEVKFF